MSAEAIAGPLAGLVVSVDELRAVCRFTDAVLPAFVTDDDASDPAIDVAALRGLAARGLVALGGDDAPELWIAPEVLAALAPTRGARLLAEVDEDAGDGPLTWAVVGGDTGPSTLLHEHGPGLVRLEVLDQCVADAVIERTATDVDPAPPGHLGFTVPRAAHEAMGAAVDEGFAAMGAAALVSAGAPVAAAEAFVGALDDRRRAVAVRIARNLGVDDDGPFEAAEVHWVEGRDGTAWQLSVELVDEDDPVVDQALAGPAAPEVAPEDEVFEARLAAVVQPTSGAELAHAIRRALTPSAVGHEPGAHR